MAVALCQPPCSGARGAAAGVAVTTGGTGAGWAAGARARSLDTEIMGVAMIAEPPLGLGGLLGLAAGTGNAGATPRTV